MPAPLPSSPNYQPPTAIHMFGGNRDDGPSADNDADWLDWPDRMSMLMNSPQPPSHIHWCQLGSLANRFAAYVHLWQILHGFIPEGFNRLHRQHSLAPELAGHLTTSEQQGLTSFLSGLPRQLAFSILSSMRNFGILSRFAFSQAAGELRSRFWLDSFIQKTRDLACELDLVAC